MVAWIDNTSDFTSDLEMLELLPATTGELLIFQAFGSVSTSKIV